MRGRAPRIRCGNCTPIGFRIFHKILPLEICLPNYVLISSILKISWFPQGSSEVKLQRELDEEQGPLEYAG